MVHQLNVHPTMKPVKQKMRNFAPEQNQVTVEKVNKLLQAVFISKVHYPDWLANVVLVKKANDKWKMCVDFIDPNKTCPKELPTPPNRSLSGFYSRTQPTQFNGCLLRI